MKYEIIFCDSNMPLVRHDVEAFYTMSKGMVWCFQLDNGLIVKYPAGRIGSVVHEHGPHMATTRKAAKETN